MAKPKTLVVSIPGMIGPRDLQSLSQYADVDYREMDSISEADLARMCAGFEYLMLNMDVVPKSGNLRLSPRFYDAASVRSLKSIAVDMTGVDYFSPQAAKAAGVMLQNIPHYSSQSVAESILAEVLLHSRQRHLAYQDERVGKPAEARKGINLKDRQAGVVGMGSIGRAAAGLLSAVGMKVRYWNRSGLELCGAALLPELFENSDVICVCAKTVIEGPDANVGMIGASLLSRCKGAIVVNLANELLIDPDAMSDALGNGAVSGYSVEASPAQRSTLGRFPQVHFPPPNAWNSDESMSQLRQTWVENLVSAIRGNPQNVYGD